MTMQTQSLAAEAAIEEEAIAHDEAAEQGSSGEDEVVAIITEEVTEIEITVEEESAEEIPEGDTGEQPSATVMRHPRADRNQHLRIVEAIDRWL